MAEAEHLSYLRGYNDRLQQNGEYVKVTLQSDEFRPGKYFDYDSTYTVKEVQIRDYSPLLPALKTGEQIGTNPQDLYLTLDARLQTMIQNELEKFVQNNKSLEHKNYIRVSAVILDAKNGDLLASAMYPLPDQDLLSEMTDRELNVYSDNNRKADWTAYSDMDLGLMYETAPGSTAKLLTAMAGLKQEGTSVLENEIYIDSKEIIRKNEPSGYIKMADALKHSSNPYFIHLLNSRNLYEPLVNIYSTIGCDIDNIDPKYLKENDQALWEEGALELTKGAVKKYERYMESTERMKLNNGRFPTCWAWAWGQGGANSLKASPIAMARGISIAANGGQMTKTRYVLDENKTVNKIPVLERSEAFELKKMLNNNVYAYASFYNVQGKESIGGKSGTPQRDLIGVADNVTDGWFICYIDNVTVGTEKTSLAVAVRLERGGGSSSAAKITTEAILPTLRSLKYIK
jgi:cell division protein FtsI/penicillin-binding protein 2